MSLVNFCKNFLFFSLFFILFLNTSFAVDSATSSKLSRCITCHTMSGNSIVPIWPKIAEQHFDYVIKQLMEFKKGKDGNRFDPNMFAMLQGISENELVELAEHFSKQPLEKSKGIPNSVRFELGKKIYFYGDSSNKVTGCVGCHGIDGNGNKLAKFPILKWQHKDYLVTQMKKFRSGERSNDFNGIMRDISSCMTDDQMVAVAEYISYIE
ncbi:c-type cytochrome [Candidatus Azoamicus ciliaticola]|uniref:Cytochrome c4 n=1 Tax=Candidatus Azoamicus ciliaticola TaxID=2652803 RepID=A0A6J5JWK7_9GAMM|nr:c-type cytochrome [Candidatus Azoamicus ciliaticola]CAB3976276.1 Cytochrome c4 [Candidatus Azoamicus ciliaticola]